MIEIKIEYLGGEQQRVSKLKKRLVSARLSKLIPSEAECWK